MSIELPPSLAWVANLAVGENWPQGDEDRLRELSEAWEEAARELIAISREAGPPVSGVLQSMAGPVVGEFQEFAGKFLRNLPETARSADQLAGLARTTATELQYAKYMILVQLVWMAAEISQWALFAPAAVPAIVAAGRVAVRMILRRLLLSIAVGIGLMAGMDAAVQAFQMMLGDRTQWNAQNTLSMVKAGAIGGAVGGAIPVLGDLLAPKFAGSLVGKLITGGVTGVAATVAQDALLGGHSALASAFTSGMTEALSGGGRRFRWQGPEGADVNPVDVRIPGLPDIDLSRLETGAPPQPDQPGGGGRPGGGGQLTESGGPPATVPTTSDGPPATVPTTDTTGTGGGASGTRRTDASAGTGAGAAPVSVADAAPATGPDRNTGSRRGDGDGADRTERQRDERDERFARWPADEQPGGTVTRPPRTPADDVPGTVPARPARGLPGFGTVLLTPGSDDVTALRANSSPVPAQGRVPVPAEGSEGAGRRGIAVSEGATSGSAPGSRPLGDRRPVTETGPGSGSRGDEAGGRTHLEPALPQDGTRADGQVPTDENGTAPGSAAAPITGTVPDNAAEPGVGSAPGNAAAGGRTVPDAADGPAGETRSTDETVSAEETGTGPAGEDQPGLQAILDLPQLPAAFDPAQLPDPSPQALLPGLPSAPSEAIAELLPQVQRNINELTGIARSAGLAESGWQQQAEATRTGDWGETARRLEELRTAVEHGLLDRRLGEFRSHVQGGFARLEQLGIRPDDWQAQVDAVERAAGTGEVVLTDSALREYTAFVERHLPVEVLNRRDTPGSFDGQVEQLRRELTAVGDPAERQRLAGLRSYDENIAALRRELRQEVEVPVLGSDRPGPGSGGRLDRLVEEGLARRAEQELERAREQLEYLRREPAEHVPLSEAEIDALPSVPGTKPDGLPGMPATRPEATNAAGAQPRLEDLPGTPVSDDVAARIADEIEGLPSAPASPLAATPLARPSDVDGPGPAEAPQARPTRAEPSTARPGSETAQLQHLRPEVSPARDTALPSAPWGTHVDRATMPARVLRVDDLERTLADLEDHSTAAEADQGTSVQPPEASAARTESDTGQGLPPEHGESLAQPQSQESAPVREPDETAPQMSAQTQGERAASAEGPVRAPEEVQQPAAPPSHQVPRVAAAEGDRAGWEARGDQSLVPDPALRRYAERQFGKLDEQTAGRLWAEASRITGRHTTFDLTFGRPGEGLLERDPGQYWAVMRVAQTLHQHVVAWAVTRVAQELPQHAVYQAVAVAEALAAEVVPERPETTERPPGTRSLTELSAESPLPSRREPPIEPPTGSPAALEKEASAGKEDWSAGAVPPVSQAGPDSSAVPSTALDGDPAPLQEARETTSGQAVLNEGITGPRVLGDGAVDLSAVRGADELRELMDALGRREAPLRVPQVERAVEEAREGLREAGVDPAVLHGTVHALREAALERLQEQARQALDAYPSGQAGGGLGGFSVDPAWGDGHRVVDDRTKLGHEFDAAREVMERDLPLFDAPEELAGLWAVERPSEGMFRLLGDPQLLRRFGIAPADAELARRAGALFQVIDREQGHRYHFTRGGLRHTDRRLEASLGYLRLDAGDADGTPQLLNADGVPATEGVWRVEPAGGERVALVPAPDHRHPERPLERLEVDTRTGRVVVKIIGAPDVRGRLLREYWRIDHEAGTARRQDAKGTPLTGPYDTAVVGSGPEGGVTLTSDPGGRVLFRHPDEGDARAAGARESGAEPAGSELPLGGEGLPALLCGARVYIERGPGGAVVGTLVGHGWGTGFTHRVEALPGSLAGVLGDGFTIVNQVTSEALHFDAARRLRAVTGERALGGEGLPARLSGLKVERIRIPATDVTSAVDVVRLVGDPALTDSFTVARLEGEMATRLPDGFSVTDTVTGETLYFNADARFVFRRTEGGSDAVGSDLFARADNDLSANDSREPEAPKSADAATRPAGGSASEAPSEAERPWYFDRDALGEVSVVKADALHVGLASQWANRIAYEVTRPGDSEQLTTAIREGIRGLLMSATKPDAGHETRAGHTADAEQRVAFWENALQRGHLILAGDQVVWLRPVLRNTAPVPVEPIPGLVKYKVGYGRLTTDVSYETAKTSGVGSLMQLVVSTPSNAVPTVMPMPVVSADGAWLRGTELGRDMTVGRKVFATEHTQFRGGAHVLVFVDGVQRPHTVVAPKRITVEVPEKFSTPGGPRPDGPWLPNGRNVIGHRSHHAREVVNAIDLIPVTAALQRHLREAGLPAHGVQKVMSGVLSRLNEKSALNRSRYWLTNGVVSDRTRFSTGPGRSFEGHVFMHAEIERLEYLGDTPGVAVREDTSGNTTASRTQGARSRATVGLTFFSVSALRKVALMPTAELKFRPRRDTRHGLTEGSETHTVLTATSDQARYRARLRMTVEVRSSTHRIPGFRHPVEAELGVPARESADFERRLLGDGAPPLRQALLSLDGPVEAQPHMRTLLREAGLALSESVGRRPARLDRRPLPPPHPREPLALATRRGAGFAAEMALPGAELVHDQIRSVLEDWHNKLSGKAKGNAKADWSGTDHELLTWFARPALEVDLPRLLSGVHHTVRLGRRSYTVSVRAHLLNRIGGATGSDAYPMKVNLRSQQIAKVKGRRDMRWNLGGALGLRLGIKVRPWGEIRLGTLHGSLGFGRDVRYALSSGTKSYQRTQASGPVDEHVYDVVYEVSVRPPGHPAQRWWIDKPGDVVARVVVPHQHVPATPLSTSELAAAGTVSRPTEWPNGSTAGFRNGTAGLFPVFLTTPELPETAAQMYQKANNLPADWIKDRANWPTELVTLTDSLHLSADFAVLTSRAGKVVELPAGTDGWKQVLRLRMTGYEPRHVAAHSGEGRTVEVQHYAQGHEYLKQIKRNLSEAGLNAMLGFRFRLGDTQESGAAAWNPAGAGGNDHSGEVHAQVNVAASGELLWERLRSSSTEEGPVGNSRAAYKGTIHTYRTDPVFEITLERWKNPGLISRGSGMRRRTEYLRVTGGLDFLVAERRITDLGLPVPEGMEEVQPHKPVGYVDAAVLPAVSHPEILHADAVLDRMKRWLTDQGVLHLHRAEGGSHGQRPENQPENRPTLLLRELERSFSSEALLSQFSLLSGGGVTRWLPLPWAYGGTLWINVTAEVGPPVSQLSRPEVRLMTRAHTHRETAKEAATFRTADFSAQLLARIGTSVHGGPGLGMGYARTSGKGAEQVEREMDMHRAITEEGSQEFEHPVKFRIRMGITMEAPEILSAPARSLRSGVFGVAGLLGHRRDVAGWWYRNQPFVKRFPSSAHPEEGIVDGTVRLVVPDHLVVPGTPPAPAPAPVGTATWEPDTPVQGVPVQDALASRTDRELLERLLEDGHPWALPAAAAAHRWAALPAAPFRPPHDLTAPDAWHVPGLDFTTLDGLRYRLFTSENLMRANIGRLLRHQYEVRVGGRTATVGLDITSIKTLGTLEPESGISFAARHHRLPEEATTDTFEQTRGWHWEAGPDIGGEARHGLAVLEHAPATWGLETTVERRGETAEVEEPDQDRSRLYRHYRADVDLVVGGPWGRLRVHVPDGLYFMLPADYSSVPFQTSSVLSR